MRGDQPTGLGSRLGLLLPMVHGPDSDITNPVDFEVEAPHPRFEIFQEVRDVGIVYARRVEPLK